MALPIRTRLALFSGALIALLMVGVGTFLYLRLEADLVDAVDETLEARAAAIGDGLRDGLPTLNGFPGLDDEQFVEVLSPEGDLLADSGNFSARDLSSELARGSGPRFVELEVLTAESESVPARIFITPGSEGRVIVVGASLEDQREALGRLLVALGLGGPVAVALASGVGWLLARGALRPVERMRSEAGAISASELSRRLPVPNNKDELGRLGETLNEMLERLETAMDRERRFVDDAAHELRTPLANLKAELELALRRARTPEALREAVQSANEEAERLVRLAEDLLVLSRSDRGRLPIRREESDVGDLLEETAASFRTRASSRGVTLAVSGPDGVKAQLDRARFRQMAGNLLENAIRHTPSGGRVSIELSRREGTFAIGVADTGEGFDASFLPRAFEPFGRSDAARSRAAGGTGLGLSIVRAVVQAHGGTAEAANGPNGGAVVKLVFPNEDLIPDSRSSHGRSAMVPSAEREEET